MINVNRSLAGREGIIPLIQIMDRKQLERSSRKAVLETTEFLIELSEKDLKCYYFKSKRDEKFKQSERLPRKQVDLNTTFKRPNCYFVIYYCNWYCFSDEPLKNQKYKKSELDFHRKNKTKVAVLCSFYILLTFSFK